LTKDESRRRAGERATCCMRVRSNDSPIRRLLHEYRWRAARRRRVLRRRRQLWSGGTVWRLAELWLQQHFHYPGGHLTGLRWLSPHVGAVTAAFEAGENSCEQFVGPSLRPAHSSAW